MGSTGTLRSSALCVSVAKVTAASIALTLIAASTLYLWVALLFVLFTSMASITQAVIGAILFVGVPTGGYLYLIVRMSARHDLGLAYRVAWICLPTAALGMWVFLLLLADAMSSVI